MSSRACHRRCWDIARDRQKLGVLLAAIVATLAAGLDPHVFGPSSPTVQAALRTRPQIETVYLLAVVAQAACFLVGGVIGDLGRRRRVLLVGLGLLTVGETLAMLGESGPLFIVGRLLAASGVGLSVPVALAWVALSYDGVRARPRSASPMQPSVPASAFPRPS